MKKFIFLILPAVMIMLASCMDSASGNGGAGSVRVALPGASRDVSGSANADSYTVSLLKGGKVIESQTAAPGGAVEFNELDAGDYTVDVEATLSGSLSGVGSAEVAVTEGETASCSVLMNRVYTAAQAADRITDNNGENWNIIVAGAIDDDELTEITGNLKDVLTNGCINLDLSRTTGLSSIGAAKFQNCTALSGIVLPKGIESIDENAFEECTSLASVTIPNTVTSIGDSAFESCSALESIDIPDSVMTIRQSAFLSCSDLKSIKIPKNVTKIEAYCFQLCSALETVVISDGFSEIGMYAFDRCAALVRINIPDSVTAIAEYAFSECSGLESIELLGKLTTINFNTFYNCKKLKSIYIPASVNEIGFQAFYGCDALTIVNYGGTKDNWNNSITINTDNDVLSSTKVTIICTDGTIPNS